MIWPSQSPLTKNVICGAQIFFTRFLADSGKICDQLRTIRDFEKAMARMSGHIDEY